MRQRPLFKAIVSLFVVTALSLSAESGAAAESPASQCASVGNDDQVRPIPPGLVGQAMRLFDLMTEDAGWAKESTAYRCMSGSVWLCNYGANLLCAKADTWRSMPSVAAYCKQNPNDEVVPMVVTGHGVNHFWGCVHGKPRINETEEVDERGFIANQWKRLGP